MRMTNLVRSTLPGLVLLALVAGSVRAQGSDEYVDDFSGSKAQDDCWLSSIFWPGDIDNPPPRPYLSYLDTGGTQGLVFTDYGDELAQLAYSFRLGTAPAGVLVVGTLRLDIAFPCNAQVSQFQPGQFLYSTSPDGLIWSLPEPLQAGHHEIPLRSTTGTCYVLFTGARAVMNNLEVSVPGATVRVQANYGAAYTVYHVDGRTGRDTNSGHKRTSAFATLQKAIEQAQNGDAIVVWPGVYQEEIAFNRKVITVQSATEAAVLRAPGGYAVSFYGAESSKSVLANFVITGCGLAGIFCDGASPTLRNLTVAGNQVGIVVYGGANPYIVNCIIHYNTLGALSAYKANFNWRIYYSCVDQANLDKTRGNINANPLFYDYQNGDFHLRSRWGRYVALTDTWTFADLTTSPCLDGGDPDEGPRAERSGSRINMGAYGGTPFASLSSEPRCP